VGASQSGSKNGTDETSVQFPFRQKIRGWLKLSRAVGKGVVVDYYGEISILTCAKKGVLGCHNHGDGKIMQK